MIIPENKQEIYEEAVVLSNSIMNLIMRECLKSTNTKEPSEQIYYVLHTIARVNVRAILSLDGFSKTYGIEKMDKNIINEWLNIITKELLYLMR